MISTPSSIQHVMKPTKRKRNPRPHLPNSDFTKKFSSKLAKPFEISDTLIVGGKLQKLSYGLHIQIAEDAGFNDLVLDIFLGSYVPPDPNDSDVTHDSDPIQSLYLLSRDEYFYIEITATPETFEIDIRDSPYELDRENLSQNGKFLKIGGSIAFLTQVQHRAVQPIEWPLWRSTNIVKSENHFLHDFPQQVQPGRVVLVTGLPYGSVEGVLEFCFTQNAHPIPAFILCADFNEDGVQSVMGMTPDEQLEHEQPYDTTFPFEINRKFRIAFGFTPVCFIAAINGNAHSSFRYRSADLPSALNGFYVRTSGGLKVKIVSVDHIDTGNSGCGDFEAYSDLRYEVE